MAENPSGRAALSYLRSNPVPFSYTDEGDATFFKVFSDIDLSLRFYGRGIRNGCKIVWSRVPESIESALYEVERAADYVGHQIEAPSGALLVVDNRFSLHDRMQQTVLSDQPLRSAMLCFVG